jgi:TonB family protein
LEPDGPDLIAPILQPSDLPLSSQGKCKEKRHQTVTLGAIITAKGMPFDIMFIRPLGTDLDRAALMAIQADRFMPATKNGQPVAVSRAIDVEVEACVEKYKDKDGRKVERVWLATQPRQILRPVTKDSGAASFFLRSQYSGGAIVPLGSPFKIGNGVSAPVPLVSPEAVYTDKARRAKISGMILVSVLVDPHGIPGDARIIKSLEPGLDQSALDAVNNYRFMPALAKGNYPVPVKIMIEVHFRLY